MIAIGDPLFGSTLTFFSFHRGLNDAGDVAFFYSLASGVSGIAVAFVPEPGNIMGTGAAFATLSLVATRRRRG